MGSTDLVLSENIQQISCAENQLKTSAEFLFDDFVLISNRGDFYFNQSRYDMALDYFLRALGMDSKNAQTYYKIAKCYMKKNLINDAIVYMEKALLYDEQEPQYLSELARLYYKKNNFEKAEELFKKLIFIVPDDAWAYSNLGNIYFYHLNDLENAYKYYKLSVETDKNYVWGLYNYACVKVLYNQFDEAIELYERACEISPENEIFKFGLAHTYYRVGNIDKTITLFNSVLEINKYNPDVLVCLGKIYLKDKKDNIKARKYFEDSLRLDKNNSEIFYYLAKISFLDFDKNNAIINITYAIELDSENDKFLALKNMIEEMEDNNGAIKQ